MPNTPIIFTAVLSLTEWNSLACVDGLEPVVDIVCPFGVN